MRVLHLTTEFPPVIYGGLGTAVGGWVQASAREGMNMGVLLIEGQLVLDDAEHAGRRQGVHVPAGDADLAFFQGRAEGVDGLLAELAGLVEGPPVVRYGALRALASRRQDEGSAHAYQSLGRSPCSGLTLAACA